RDGLGVDALRHEVMALVSQRTDDLGRERLVEQLHDRVAVCGVPGRDRALLDVLARTLAQRLDVADEGRFIAHVVSPVQIVIGKAPGRLARSLPSRGRACGRRPATWR